jgi:hypothetical protein
VVRHHARVVIVEPLIKAHSVDENSNVDMDAVIDAFVAMAEEENVSITLRIIRWMAEQPLAQGWLREQSVSAVSGLATATVD